MDKLDIFQGSPVSYIETQQVKAGVECDIYSFNNNVSKDLAIVRVQKGFKTPLQRVVKGDKTIEGFLSGEGTLKVKPESGETKTYHFKEGGKGEVVVQLNEVMQWESEGSDLVFYEICEPPYEDGRFESLPN